MEEKWKLLFRVSGLGIPKSRGVFRRIIKLQ